MVLGRSWLCFAMKLRYVFTFKCKSPPSFNLNDELPFFEHLPSAFFSLCRSPSPHGHTRRQVFLYPFYQRGLKRPSSLSWSHPARTFQRTHSPPKPKVRSNYGLLNRKRVRSRLKLPNTLILPYGTGDMWGLDKD